MRVVVEGPGHPDELDPRASFRDVCWWMAQRAQHYEETHIAIAGQWRESDSALASAIVAQHEAAASVCRSRKASWLLRMTMEGAVASPSP